MSPDRRAFLQLLSLLPVGLAGCRAGEPFALYNWGDYLAPDVLAAFLEQERARGYGRVHAAQDFFLSEAELVQKLRAGARHDVVLPIDYLMSRLAKEALLRPLELAALPGVAHLDPAYPPWRLPEEHRARHGDGVFGIPYFWGVTGIGYDSDKVDPPPTSWRALFDPKYRGRISVMDGKGDVFDQGQLAAGLGINSTDKDAIRDVVFPTLVEQKRLLRAYDSNPERALASGETWIAQVDSGDLMRAKQQRPSLRFVVPEEGAPYWVDYLAIPSAAADPARALRFLEFMLDPEIAARNANYLHFATPNKTALDRGLIEDARDEQVYARVSEGKQLPRSVNWAGGTKQLVDELWIKLRGA